MRITPENKKIGLTKYTGFKLFYSRCTNIHILLVEVNIITLELIYLYSRHDFIVVKCNFINNFNDVPKNKIKYLARLQRNF